MITSRDVARLAGVSQPTVSRALSGSRQVAEATRERVRSAAATLGYAPSAAGRALSLGRSTRVGLVVTDLRNSFYPHVIAPMHDELERRGHELALLTESSEAAPVAEHAVAHGLAGVVLATASVGSVLPARLRERRVPFVHFNRTSGLGADSVTVDPWPGVREMVAAVAAGPPVRVGAVFGPRQTSTGAERERAVRAALHDAGVPLAERDVRHGPFDHETGDACARDLLGRADPPGLIIASSDVVAVGVLNAAAATGLRVPEQVGVVGFDDLPTSRWPVLDLSTIGYDLDAMSRAAVTVLLARVEDGPGPGAVHRRFTTRYVARSTTLPGAWIR